jgi:hypothetical protein
LPAFVIAAADDAIADMGPEGPHNPAFIGALFLNGTTQGWPVADVLTLVTPESAGSWGDFSGVRDLLTDCGMTSRVQQAVGDPEVVYVRYVASPAYNMESLEEQLISVRAVATLVWRPEHDRWLVHQVGDYLPPDLVPHT